MTSFGSRVKFCVHNIFFLRIYGKGLANESDLKMSEFSTNKQTKKNLSCRVVMLVIITWIIITLFLWKSTADPSHHLNRVSPEYQSCYSIRLQLSTFVHTVFSIDSGIAYGLPLIVGCQVGLLVAGHPHSE